MNLLKKQKEIELKVEDYFKQTRLLYCQTTICVHNNSLGCNVKEVYIDVNRKCSEYMEKG